MQSTNSTVLDLEGTLDSADRLTAYQGFPATSLATELLSAIFVHTTVVHRASIACVCRRWSGVIARDLTLWTTLDFSGCTNVQGRALDAFLMRSRAAQVEIRALRYRESPAFGSQHIYTTAATVLAQHMARVSVLELILDGGPIIDDLNHLVLSCPAPVLRAFSLKVTPPPSDHWHRPRLPAMLFQDLTSTPNLRSLHLEGFDLQNLGSRLRVPHGAQIRVEELTVVKCISPETIELSVLMPALRQLRLDRIADDCPFTLCPYAAKNVSLTLTEKYYPIGPCRDLARSMTDISHATLQRFQVVSGSASIELLGILLSGLDGDGELSITPSFLSSSEYGVPDCEVRLSFSDGRVRLANSVTPGMLASSLIIYRHLLLFGAVHKLTATHLHVLVYRDWLDAGSLRNPHHVFPRLEEIDLTFTSRPYDDVKNGAVRAMCRTARRITLRMPRGTRPFVISWAKCIELFAAEGSRTARFPDVVDLHGVELKQPPELADETADEGRFYARIRFYDAETGRLNAGQSMGSG